jgi:hypothetical protein
VQSGLKGFIYGDRGVWRPGDPYTTFILEDKLKTLPADHPVEFELYMTRQVNYINALPKPNRFRWFLQLSYRYRNLIAYRQLDGQGKSWRRRCSRKR